MIPQGYVVLLLCGPFAAVAVVWVAQRIGVPYPALLVALGALLYLVPWVGTPDISPNIVFYVFVPPLVYYAANFIAPDDLHANARSIGLLAVGLVVVSTAAVAGALVGIAGLPLAVAVVAGVVVAPTDPVSATTIFRRLDTPERLTTIVEGEGLTNDGTALVLYQGALGTVMAGELRPGHLAVTLLAAPAGGAALGLAIAWLLARVRQRIDQPVLEITISLATPYLTYALAEAVHLSGILATVAAGVYVGSRFSAIYAPGARLQALAFLDVLVFLLNGVLFTLVGMQLVRQLHSVPGMSALKVVAVVSAVVAVVITVRLGWMLLGPAIAKLRGDEQGAAAWRERLVVAWAGMRGGLSLAAALAVPLRLKDGSPFPGRDLLIMVAVAVIAASLFIQGLTMPLLLRLLGVGSEDFQKEESEMRLDAARAALSWLADQTGEDADNAADNATESLRQLYEARVRRLEIPVASDRGPDHSDAKSGELQRYSELRLKMLDVERSAVLEARRGGRINATLLRAIEHDLDLQEARLRDY